VLAQATNLKATFHHAFEDAADKFKAIEKLKKLKQIDRILAHGGKDGWAEKIFRLGDYATAAQPEIKILAGGGIDSQVISMIQTGTSIREFHVGRAARIDGKVNASRVQTLAIALRGNYD
jgi:copper homeostasis protein CutC